MSHILHVEQVKISQKTHCHLRITCYLQAILRFFDLLNVLQTIIPQATVALPTFHSAICADSRVIYE